VYILFQQDTNTVQLRAEVTAVNPLMCKAVLLLATKHVYCTALLATNHFLSTKLQHTGDACIRNKVQNSYISSCLSVPA